MKVITVLGSPEDQIDFYNKLQTECKNQPQEIIEKKLWDPDQIEYSFIDLILHQELVRITFSARYKNNFIHTQDEAFSSTNFEFITLNSTKNIPEDLKRFHKNMHDYCFEKPILSFISEKLNLRTLHLLSKINIFTPAANQLNNLVLNKDFAMWCNLL